MSTIYKERIRRNAPRSARALTTAMTMEECRRHKRTDYAFGFHKTTYVNERSLWVETIKAREECRAS